MARVQKLTARGVATAVVGKHGDGRGLWLVVRPNGSCAWVFRYQRNGRRREMGLGPADDVSLARAREVARAAREELRQGLDPLTERRSRNAAPLTFAEAATRYIAAHEAAWRNVKHRDQWTTTLQTYATPIIGALPVNRIETADVLRVLEPIWRTRPETATRVRGRLERVLDWCAVQGFRGADNPARWRGHLQALLPARSKVRPVRHHRALPWQAVPDFMVRLREVPGVAARALELAILTAARSGEVRHATWEEIDLASRVWTVPAERMKAQREHRVPLSSAVVGMLEALPWRAATGLVFPSPVTDGPLSDAILGKTVRALAGEVTAHGFRSSFRDWVSETTTYSREVAEMALAHRVPDAVEAAYRRGDLFMKRVALMEAWATFCASPPAVPAVVTDLAEHRKAADA